MVGIAFNGLGLGDVAASYRSIKKQKLKL